MGDSQYPFSLTTFSPSGKLVKVEPGQTSHGIKEENKVMEDKKENKEVISMAALKWIESGGKAVEVPKYLEKAPKFAKSVKVSPRTIHQPR